MSTSGTYDRLRQKRHELQQQYDLISEKIGRLRTDYIIKTDTSVRFQLEKEITQAETERRLIEQELQSIENELSQQALNQIYYFETSAIIKYYLDEDGSDVVRKLVENHRRYCLISTWDVVEFFSILRLSISNAGITESRERIFSSLMVRFLVDIESEGFRLEQLSNTYWRYALKIINRFRIETNIEIRASDAIHIAIFQNILQKFPNTKLVTTDPEILRICDKLELKTLNPLASS